MTNEEAAALIEWYEATSGKWAGSLGDAHRTAIAALRSPGAGAMREAAIACVREQAPPRDIRTVVTEAQVSVLDRAIAAIRALPLPAPEVPEAVKAWASEYDDEHIGFRGTDPPVARTVAAIEWNLRVWIEKEFRV